MRCIFPFDNILCRLDNACVHSFDSHDSTIHVSTCTTCATRQKIPIVPTLYAMHKFKLSLIRCIFPPENPRTRQMHIIKVNHKSHHVTIRQILNYLTFIAKLTSKTIDYENVPLERVEKTRSPLVQVKSIGQPSHF